MSARKFGFGGDPSGMFGTITDAVVAVEGGKIAYLNPAAEQLTEWSSKDGVGRTVTEVFRIVDASTREPAEDPVAKATEAGGVVGLAGETILIGRHAGERIITGTATALRDRRGNSTGVVIVFHEAMGSSSARQALLASEEQFRATFELASVGMAQVNPMTGMFLNVNEKYCELTGYSFDELLKIPFGTITHPDDRERDWAAFQRMVRGETKEYISEKRYIRKDGGTIWVVLNANLIRDSLGRPLRTVAVVQDVTARKLAEEALRVSRERLDLVLDSANIGLWYCDLRAKDRAAPSSAVEFDKIVVNATCREQLRIVPDSNVTIDSFYEQLHPDDLERTRQAIERSIEEHARYDVEYRVVAPNATTRWIRAKGRCFYDDNGAPSRFDGITLDATGQKTTEDVLREAIRARDAFLSTAAHELKNPLNALLLSVESLARLPGEPLSERAKSRLATAVRQVDRLSNLVARLLDVTRIMSGRIQLDEEKDVDLSALVRGVIDREADEISSCNSLVTVDTASSVTGRWDRFRLDQIVTNLLTNALKYGEGKPILVTVAADADFARLTIKDQGIGIREEDQRRIFERFERAVALTNVGGLGLGLWIVRAIVDAMDGKITVDSSPGEGATFTVLLPRLRNPNAASQAT